MQKSTVCNDRLLKSVIVYNPVNLNQCIILVVHSTLFVSISKKYNIQHKLSTCVAFSEQYNHVIMKFYRTRCHQSFAIELPLC